MTTDSETLDTIKKQTAIQKELLKKHFSQLEESIDIKLQNLDKNQEPEPKQVRDYDTYKLNTSMNELSAKLTLLGTKMINLETLIMSKNDPIDEKDTVPFYKKKYVKYGSIFIAGCFLTALMSSIGVKYEIKSMLRDETFTKTTVGGILMRAWPNLSKAEKEKIVEKGWDISK